MMDNLQFYVLFNSILVISGQKEADNERHVQWNPVFISTDSAKIQLEIARSALHQAN